MSVPGESSFSGGQDGWEPDLLSTSEESGNVGGWWSLLLFPSAPVAVLLVKMQGVFVYRHASCQLGLNWLKADVMWFE